MHTSKLHYLFGIIITILCLSAIPLQSQAKTNKENAEADTGKDRLVLMPLRVPDG